MSVAVDRRPTSANTGPKSGIPLTPMAGLTITKDTSLENVLISGPIAVASGVDLELRNFRLDAKGAAYGIQSILGGHVYAERGEIVNSTSSGVYASNFTGRRLNIHEHGGDACKFIDDCTLSWSVIHHLGKNDGAHADGCQTRRGGRLAFLYCSVDMPINLPGYEANAAGIFQTAEGPIEDVLWRGCWIEGGNFTLYFKDKGHGPVKLARVLDCRFGRRFRYGLLDTSGHVAQSGNVWDDTGEPIHDLGAVKKAA